MNILILKSKYSEGKLAEAISSSSYRRVLQVETLEELSKKISHFARENNLVLVEKSKPEEDAADTVHQVFKKHPNVFVAPAFADVIEGKASVVSRALASAS